MKSRKSKEEEDIEEMEEDSDTGFDSEASLEDYIVEDLEERGLKRSHSDLDTSKKTNKKLRKLRKENQLKKLHKLPTANELNRLRETENIFHSNLFRLQIEEMLKEVQIKEKHKLEFDQWFEKFSDWILKVEDNENKYEIKDQEWLKKLNIKIPISQIPYFVKGTYQFKKPCKVSCTGSYATNLLIGPKVVVDVMVEVPESFFQKEDYLNCRFHRKRSLYLCELLHHIQLLPNLIEDVAFISEEVDRLKPNLEIKPFGKLNKYFKVALRVGPARGTYKLNRFTPNKNNVRKKWYFKEDGNEQETVPTPFYNSTITADLTLEENMNFLKETISSHNNIKDGIILLKIWLRQRELHDSIGGFNGFIISMLVCYLLKVKKINFLMSSYQVFRNVCYYLIGCDWTTNGITLCEAEANENLPTMTEYHENFEVVFVDVTGYHNLCYAMSPSLFQNVQHEAQLALKWLNDLNVNSFQVLFMTKVPFYHHYDHIVIFNNSEVLENIADVHCTKEAQLSHCGVITPLVRKSVIALLHRGFGKRILHLHVKMPEKQRWKITKKPRQTFTLTIGFNLNPENYFTIVDKALETETESFREFWGAKSELRRFQDGSITEALVWSGRTLSEKRLICKEILTYLLKLKFGLEFNDFQYIADQSDFCIEKDVEERCLKVCESFDELTKQLGNLNDLPLSIVSVQGISPVFRYTDAFPPVPQKQRETVNQKGTSRNFALIKNDLNSSFPWVSPNDVVVQMAASNKWPQDLEAIRRVRAAFYAKISNCLTSQYGLICKPFQDKIEVLKNGYVFRAKIVHPNEITLLKQTVDNDGLIKYKDTEKSLALEKHSLFLPKLSSALHGIYLEHNSFGPACCLIKRWISSHLIDAHHMSEESVELLVASLYLRPQPHEPPVQPQVALFRFFQMMTTTNWNTDCIVLNINAELSRADVIEIESEFHNNRQNLPPIFIATPYDRTKSLWTKDSPTPLILLRLMELSANALQIIEAQIYTKALSEIESFSTSFCFSSNLTMFTATVVDETYQLGNQVLFKPCLDIYDVVITLNDSFNSKKKAMVRKNVDQLEYFVRKIPINDFDPVALYLKELRESYSEFALFFRDTYGGSIIAVKWKPNSLEPTDFKLVSLHARKINPKLKKLELNKESILEDFWVLGKKLVKHIDIRENGSVKRFQTFEE